MFREQVQNCDRFGSAQVFGRLLGAVEEEQQVAARDDVGNNSAQGERDKNSLGARGQGSAAVGRVTSRRTRVGEPPSSLRVGSCSSLRGDPGGTLFKTVAALGPRCLVAGPAALTHPSAMSEPSPSRYLKLFGSVTGGYNAQVDRHSALWERRSARLRPLTQVRHRSIEFCDFERLERRKWRACNLPF